MGQIRHIIAQGLVHKTLSQNYWIDHNLSRKVLLVPLNLRNQGRTASEVTKSYLKVHRILWDTIFL